MATHSNAHLEHARAFTLVEVLVVIAVISMLTALSLPAISGARHAARGVACSLRISQTAMSLRMYADDNRGHFPRTQDISYGVVTPSYDPSVTLEKTWVDLLADRGYIVAHLDTAGVPESLQCTSAHGWDNDPTWAGQMPHFGMNMNVSPPKRLEASAGQRSFYGKPFVFNGDPSTKIMMAESRQLQNLRGWFSVGNSNWIAARHAPGAGANVVYLDGHVAMRQASPTPSAADAAQPFASINFWRSPAP